MDNAWSRLMQVMHACAAWAYPTKALTPESALCSDNAQVQHWFIVFIHTVHDEFWWKRQEGKLRFANNYIFIENELREKAHNSQHVNMFLGDTQSTTGYCFALCKIVDERTSAVNLHFYCLLLYCFFIGSHLRIMCQ